jgi:signal transduction histidine kinase
LGLAIVRQVAELHGIGVRVTSRLGQGTRFELRAFPAVGAGEDVQQQGDTQWLS